MGHPKKTRSKYTGPGHPWKADRLEKEKVLVKTYGLKNKTELWKMESKLKQMKKTAKSATARRDAQSFIEEKQLLERAVRMGLLNPGASLLDLLSLETTSILDRRLQTRVFKLGLSRSVNQSRQFITHNHVLVNGKAVNIPSYIVKKDEENKITISEKSALASLDHPERVPLVKEVKLEKKPKVEEAQPAKQEKPKPAAQETKVEGAVVA